MIGAYGNFNRVVGNKAISCTAVSGFAIGVDDPNSVILDNDLTGWTNAYVINQHPYGGGTTPALQMDADRVNGTWGFRQGARFGTNANAITLDTYEAANWTPILAFGGSNVGITYNTQLGTYIRIGKLIFLTCDIILTSKGSSVGVMTITGVPYPQGGTGSAEGMVTNQFYNMTGLTVPPFFYIGNLTISGFTTVSGSNLTDANFSNITTIRFSGTYRVA